MDIILRQFYVFLQISYGIYRRKLYPKTISNFNGIYVATIIIQRTFHPLVFLRFRIFRSLQMFDQLFYPSF